MNTALKHSTGSKLSLHKRLLSILLALALVCSCSAPSVDDAFADARGTDVIYGETVEDRGLSVSDCPSIDAEYAIVMDSEGNVYFERNATDSTQIASITKVMTAIVALEAVENGEITLDTEITVSSEAASIGESSASLMAGDTLTLLDALYALLVPSGNDAAVAIAEAIAGSVDDFADLMNAKAEELGCTDTYFTNPHGLDSGSYSGSQHSCAEDVALMVQCAMTYDTFREIVAGGDATITVTRDGSAVDISLSSTDGFMDIYEYAIGVKTGYTDLAGYSFAGAALKDDVELYVVVINSSSSDQRFEDAMTLCEWVYEHLVTYSLANSTKTTTLNGEEVPLIAEVAHSEWIDVTIDVTLADPDAAMLIFDLNGNVSQSIEFDEITGDIEAGDVVGTITFKQQNEVILTMDLIACESVDAPSAFASIGIWFQRLFASLTGSQKVADTVIYNETPLIVDYSSDD